MIDNNHQWRAKMTVESRRSFFGKCFIGLGTVGYSALLAERLPSAEVRLTGSVTEAFQPSTQIVRTSEVSTSHVLRGRDATNGRRPHPTRLILELTLPCRVRRDRLRSGSWVCQCE